MALPNLGQGGAASQPGMAAMGPRMPVGRLPMKKGPAMKKPALNPRGARAALLAAMQGPMQPGG